MTGLTAGYKDDARLLSSGDLRLFLRGPDPPSNASVIAHPPGYSILMATIFSLFGELDFALRFFQIFSDAVSVVFVFLIALELISKRVAVIAGTLAALSPQLAYNSLLLLPDSLSVLPILIAVYLVVRAGNDNSRRWIKVAIAGVMLGLSCWLRPNGFLLPLFIASIFPFVFERGKRLRLVMPLVAGAVLLIAPLTIRNVVVFHRFIPISLGTGVTLVEGIADYDKAGTMGFMRTDVELVQEESRRFNRPDYANALFIPDGIPRERDRVSRGVAAIRSRPFWFLGVMIQRAGSMMRWERVPAISGSPLALETQATTAAYSPFAAKLLRVPAMILKSFQKLFVTAVMLPLALIGLFVLFKKWRASVFIFVIVVPTYFISVQSLLHTEYRYVLAVHYFLIMPIAISLSFVARTLQDASKRNLIRLL